LVDILGLGDIRLLLPLVILLILLEELVFLVDHGLIQVPAIVIIILSFIRGLRVEFLIVLGI
jgi:hypothetical protein